MAQPEDRTGISRRPRLLDLLGGGTTSEEVARENAEAVTRHARRDSSRVVEGPAPNPEMVRERRESRLRRESRREP